jgi:hypothetical protein
MRPCHMRLGVKHWRLRPAAVLAFVAGLLAPPMVVAKIINVFPPQQLLAVGRSDVSGGNRCNDVTSDSLSSCSPKSKPVRLLAAIATVERPMYTSSTKKFYPAKPPFGGIWMTTRRMTFRCWKATYPDTCAPCARVHP